MTDAFSQVTQDVLYCHTRKLLDDDLGRAMRKIFDAGVCDERIAEMFRQRVSRHQLDVAFNGELPFETPELSGGDYVIGRDLSNRPLRSEIQFLNAHCLTVAGSGAGKTMMARCKVLQIAGRVNGLFLFDLRKREFRVLKQLLKRLGIDLRVLPGRSWKINPLQRPSGVTVSDWIPHVADMLIGVLRLPTRASKLLQTRLFPLYRKYESHLCK